MDERLTRLADDLDKLSRSHPRAFFAIVALATVIVTLVLLMGQPPTVVYQAF